MTEAGMAVQQARADVALALMRAGELIVASLDGATPEGLAETDRALEDAKFKGIVLNELLLEEGAGNA